MGQGTEGNVFFRASSRCELPIRWLCAMKILIPFSFLMVLLLPCISYADPVSVFAKVETDPVPYAGDTADDPCIWVHPTDSSLSTIIGTNKNPQGGLHVYGLDGKEIQFVKAGALNNVDIRYGVMLGGRETALVTAGNRSSNSIAVYRVDPATRMLEDVAARTIKVNVLVYGSCMIRDINTNKVYFFVVSKTGGAAEQWELFDNGMGKIDACKVRSFAVGSVCEGCVADDENGVLYIAEEGIGIWKYGTGPESGGMRSLIDKTGPEGHLTADVEGLTIYRTPGGGGYLIASSQGDSRFAVYERHGQNKYVGSFQIVNDGVVDEVTGTDGIDVTNADLGPLFPNGVFVAQDDKNDTGNQNFKLVPWNLIAKAFQPVLRINTTFDFK